MNILKNKISRIILCVIGILLVSIGYYAYAKEENTSMEELVLENQTQEQNQVEKEKKEETIVVHVAGQVKQEGIVTLAVNSRMADAIEKAGGLKEEADMSRINLAYVLEDGMKLYIPKKGENLEQESNLVSQESNNKNPTQEKETSTKSQTLGTNPTATTSDTININTATQTQLETLPGIGPSTALKIIEYRKEKGKFQKIEDIKNVSGIGEAKFEKIKEKIKV